MTVEPWFFALLAVLSIPTVFGIAFVLVVFVRFQTCGRGPGHDYGAGNACRRCGRWIGHDTKRGGSRIV